MGKVKVLYRGSPKKTLHGAGDEYAFLADGSETNGRYFIMEALVPPGGGPPPHIQTREEEAFYIIEGTVTFWAEDERIEAGPGTFLHIPPDAVHRFLNEGPGTARMLIFFAPAGMEGLFDELAADPSDMEAIGARYGVTYLD